MRGRGVRKEQIFADVLDGWPQNICSMIDQTFTSSIRTIEQFKIQIIYDLEFGIKIWYNFFRAPVLIRDMIHNFSRNMLVSWSWVNFKSNFLTRGML